MSQTALVTDTGICMHLLSLLAAICCFGITVLLLLLLLLSVVECICYHCLLLSVT